MFENTTNSQMVYLSIDELFPHPDNPRRELGDLTELADSIKQNGVLQNLTVVPRMATSELTAESCQQGYTVIIGHRRLAAAKLAGLSKLPCVVMEMTEKEQIQTMLVENMQRSDLTVYEEAQGFQMMLDLGETVETIAEKSGFSQSTVRRRVKLLDLDKDKFKRAESRGATLEDYAALDKVKNTDTKNQVLDTIGTPNFQNELKKALAEQRYLERRDEWLNVIKTFAVENANCEVSTHKYIGAAISQGAAVGVRAYAAQVAAEAAAMVRNAIAAAKQAAQSNSPSKKTIALGNDLGKGLIIGIREMEDAVAEEMRDTMKKIVDVQIEVPEIPDNTTAILKAIGSVPSTDDRLLAEIDKLANAKNRQINMNLTQNIYADDTSYAGQQREAKRNLRQIARELNR